MEHPGAVVLHLRRHEVEVPGLVVGDAHVEPPVTPSITGPVGWPGVTVVVRLAQLGTFVFDLICKLHFRQDFGKTLS